MIQVNGYTSAEIQVRATVSGQKVRKWAKVHKWSISKIGSVNIYNTQDVDDFFTARLRRKLMKAAGWTKAGKLIWSDTWDRNCPKCEGFAVEKPAKQGEAQSEQWLTGEVDLYCEYCGLIPQDGLENESGSMVACPD